MIINGEKSSVDATVNLIMAEPATFYIQDEFYNRMLKSAADALALEEPINTMSAKKWKPVLDHPTVTYEPMYDNKQSMEKIQIPLTYWFKNGAVRPTLYNRTDGRGYHANMYVTYDCLVEKVPAPEPSTPPPQCRPEAEMKQSEFAIEQFKTNQDALDSAMATFDELARKYPFMPANVVTERLQKLLHTYRKECAFGRDDDQNPTNPDQQISSDINLMTYADWQKQTATKPPVQQRLGSRPQQRGQQHQGGGRGRGSLYSRQSSTSSNGSTNYGGRNNNNNNYSYSY